MLQDTKESSKQCLDMNGADFQAFCIEVGWVSGPCSELAFDHMLLIFVL